MTIAERFADYIQAFEDTYADNDWSRLEPFFTPGAVYATGGGETLEGRDRVLGFLRNDVESLDRKFDARELVFEPPVADGNRVTARWRCTLRKAGAPELVGSGVETADFDGDAICWMQSSFDDGVAGRFGAWFERHGALLAS